MLGTVLLSLSFSNLNLELNKKERLFERTASFVLCNVSRPNDSKFPVCAEINCLSCLLQAVCLSNQRGHTQKKKTAFGGLIVKFGLRLKTPNFVHEKTDRKKSIGYENLV